jgi:sugar diacid utilization regulator
MDEKAVAAQVVVLGERMADELDQLTQEMQMAMLGQIPDLEVDRTLVQLLGVSIRSNLETIVQVLRNVVDVDNVITPIGAREYTRRLAQHGVSPDALLRAYRLGQRMLMDWGFATLTDAVDVPPALESYHALAQLTYRYVDSISEQVVAEYQQERERWLAHRSTVVADILDRLLAGDPVDIDSAETVLGHRLRQHHVGVLLWTADPAAAAVDLAVLENVVARLDRAIGGRESPMFWPKDRATVWAWLSVHADADMPDPRLLEDCLAGIDPQVRVALGTPAAGPGGFRATHLEARRAQQVALVASDRGARVTSFGDPGVRAASLLVNDLEAARRLVRTTLGGLALDTEAAERLRETTLIFLAEKGSYTTTSERLHLHKNTVKYRIKRAIEERGRSVDENRLELELALIACQWLGPAVLVPKESLDTERGCALRTRGGRESGDPGQ